MDISRPALALQKHRVTPSPPLAWGLGLAFVLAVPVFANPGWLRVGMIICIWAVLASGLNLIVGFCGLLNFGYIAFFALGAYLSALVSTRVFVSDGLDALWWVFPLDIVLGGLVAGLAGVILGYPTLRLRGDYLAIMTLAFGELIRVSAINWTSLTNGTTGISGVPVPSLFGLSIDSQTALFYLAVGLAVLIFLVLRALIRSHVGRAWIAIREDEDAAETLGVPTSRYKLYAYTAGAVAAGMMGVFFVHAQRFISPDSFNLVENFIVLLLIVIGGLGSIWGPVAGAVIWYVALEKLSELSVVQDYPEVRQTILALILIVVMLAAPRGLFGRTRTLIGEGGST